MANERLIDADELLRDAETYGPISAGLADMYDVKWLVDAQLTVDAVPVVRCKDCKYSRVASWGERYCGRKGIEGLDEMSEDDFCSYGERRNTNG